jgi:hypothetical protein
MKFVNGVKPGARKSFGQYKPLMVFESEFRKTEVLETAERELDANGFRTKRCRKRGSLYDTKEEAMASNMMYIMACGYIGAINEKIYEAETREEKTALMKKRDGITKAWMKLNQRG